MVNTGTNISIKRRIRVLFLHRTLQQSGAVRQLMYLYHGLDRSQFDPYLVVQRMDNVYDPALLDQPGIRSLSKKGASFAFRLWSFLRLVRQLNPDVIQAFNRGSSLLAYSASLLVRLRIPTVGSIRRAHIHPKHMLVERLFRNRIAAMVVNSERTRRDLVVQARMPESKTLLIPNGIDTDKFRPFDGSTRQTLRQELGIRPEEFVIISVGRVHRAKNLMVTLNALKKLMDERIEKPLRYYCIGKKEDVEIYQRMVSFIDENGMRRWCSFIDPTDRIIDYYQASDVMVLSSIWEGLPNVTLEAMACGTVTVVSEAADNDRVIEHAVNGFKFPTHDATALTALLKHIIDLDVSRLQSIRLHARRDVVEKFSLHRMITQFEALYRQLAGT